MSVGADVTGVEINSPLSCQSPPETHTHTHTQTLKWKVIRMEIRLSIKLPSYSPALQHGCPCSVCSEFALSVNKQPTTIERSLARV